MNSVSDIFRSFGPEYLERYANRMPKTHRKAIDAITACRTELCGIALYQCQHCCKSDQLYRSCGNRHCSTCQQHKTQQWLQKQLERQLPAHHFLITFTVPENLRSFIRKNQRAAYSALFKTSSDAIKKLALDQHLHRRRPSGLLRRRSHLGRTLQYHPDIHYIVAGGALSLPMAAASLQNRLLSPRQSSLHHLQSNSSAIKSNKPACFDQILSELWHIDWNVDSQAVPSIEACLKYLAAYVFKVAISNSRIFKVQDRTVCILYRKPHSDRLRTLALEIMEIIRRFLQHALPTGFMKLRSTDL